jgi:mannose-6-phosphate isomerase class I
MNSNFTPPNEVKPANISNRRLTQQYLLPATKHQGTGNSYDIYPAFPITETIHTGFISLAGWIIEQGNLQFVIDGYAGVFWETFINSLCDAFDNARIPVHLIDISKCLKPESDIDNMIASSLGADDPLFGKAFTGHLSDFYNSQKLAALRPHHSHLTILYGCGAALANWDAPLIFVDVPKNEIQFRARAGKAVNLGTQILLDPKAHYKRSYFIDWPVLNKHKNSILPHIGAFVDEQRGNEISWIKGEGLREVLTLMSKNVLRARPWFEPGVWGGQWIKNNIENLNRDVVNYAWSFELIAPENGLLLEHDNHLLEISFDMLLFNNNKAILGKAANRFGYNFPIRFDFLDTIDGDNLSLQCHPTVAYTKQNFGEDFTQDETYYILEAEPGAEVYLGFQDNINRDELREVLENSFKNNEPVAVKKYVQTFQAKKHDLFLIPNGTIHCSGKGNLVLEISATPYIFTFKLYDWLRPDLTGAPRTLNINRAFENLNFNRMGAEVPNTLISKTSVIKQGADWQLLNLSTHDEHFYAIERFEFETEVMENTNGQCHILSLVEGDSIIVKTGDLEQMIHYAETFIIPAAAEQYMMINRNAAKAKVVKAFVKDQCC